MAAVVNVKCPNCGADLPIQPAQDSATCKYCGTSAIVRKRDFLNRVPAPPPHLQGVPVVHVPNHAAKWAILIVLITTVLPVALSVGALAPLAAMFAVARAKEVTSMIPSLPAPIAPVVAPAAPPCDLFCDASPIRVRLGQLYGGPVMARGLLVYPDYAIVEAQDPKQPEHVDRRAIRRDSAQVASQPVRIDRAKLKSELFPVDAVDFGLVAKVAKDALARSARVEGGKVSHIMYGAAGPKKLGWTVYVSGPRDSGVVEYDDKACFAGRGSATGRRRSIGTR